MGEFFKYLFRPSWWVRNYETCLGLDKKINELIDEGVEIHIVDKYECDFGGMRLWIENHPYASCRLGNFVPKRSTVERFFSYMNYNAGEGNANS